MKARVCRAVISSFVLGLMLITSGIVATRSSLASKTAITPHQLTIFFTGDDWAGYKGACG